MTRLQDEKMYLKEIDFSEISKQLIQKDFNELAPIIQNLKVDQLILIN